MTAIVDSYARLAEETGRPCYSVTFWRTTDGLWGARAGLGSHEFGKTIEDAVEAAVTNAIAAQAVRRAQDAELAAGPQGQSLASECA